MRRTEMQLWEKVLIRIPKRILTRSSQLLASRDGERDDENFPSNIECTPELFVVDAQGARVSPQAVDRHRVFEEGLSAVVRRQLAGKLTEEGKDALAGRIIAIERVGGRAGKERGEQVVDAFGVKERRENREDFRCGDTQRHHRHRYARSCGIGTNDIGCGQDWQIRAMSGNDDVVDWEEGHAALGGSRNMTGVHCQHMRGHIRGEIVDHHCEFLRENVGGGLGFDARQDLKHAIGLDERPTLTLENNNLLGSKALKSFVDIVQSRVCQLGRDGRDRLLRDSAERGPGEVSREGHIGQGHSRGRVRRIHISRGAGNLDVDQGGLHSAPVLGVLDGVSRVMWTTRGSSTAATRGSLDATSDSGLCVRKSGGGRGVFLIESASEVGGMEDHDADGADARSSCASEEAPSDCALIKDEFVDERNRYLRV